MNLVLINGSRFAPALRELGHSVLSIGALPESEIRLTPAEMSWTSVRAHLPWEPDGILLELFGNRAFVEGLPAVDLPLVAYAFDGALNGYWLRHYGQVLDHMLVDHRPTVEELTREGVSASWMPLSVDEDQIPEPRSQRDRDPKILFVGRTSSLRLKRDWLLEFMEPRLPVRRAGGDGEAYLTPVQMYQRFAASALVLNENLFAGWTLRMFEAMACGAVLFSEKVPARAGALFADGEHFDAFGPADILPRARKLLEHPSLREELAERGRSEVLGGHTHRHRAQQIVETFLKVRSARPQREAALLALHEAEAYRLTMLRWPRTAPVLLRRAAGLLERARKNSSLRGYATLRLGMVHGQWSRDHERTLSLLLDAFAALQGSLRARLALVEYLRFLGQEERALVLLESWLGTGSGKGPSSLLWREVGNRLAEEGARCQPGFVRGGEDRFPSTALDYYKRASEGGDTEAAWKAGELFADMDDEAGAYLWVASYALKHCRDHPERLFRLGQWAHRSYRFAEAARLLDLAVEGDPGLASRRHHFPDPER